ncbi:MAG: 50S ribosomal protein L11 methyltransferase [Bdellovibrionales bacterium]
MNSPQLWILSFSAPSDAAQTLADSLEETALSVTVLAPPREAEAQVEALFQDEPDKAEWTARLAILAALQGREAPTIAIAQTPPLDWLKKVAEDFPPLRIARWTIHGAQHRAAVPNRLNALQIDATNAFGTGEHPTTRGCLIMLNKLLKRQGHANRKIALLDMGCGSGILAMALLKARRNSHATGIDCDDDSVRIARNNARANGLSKRLTVEKGRGYRPRKVKASALYDLAMANIFAGPLAHMAKDLKNHLRPGGYAILSGLLNHQANKVLAAHRLQRLRLAKRLTLGEWTVLVLKRT